MRIIIFTSVLIMLLHCVYGQGKSSGNKKVVEIETFLPHYNFIKTCDTNTSITNMSMKMFVPKTILPKPTITNSTTSYDLKYAKSKNHFSYQKRGEGISFWLDQNVKHCVTLNTNYDISFDRYDFNKNEKIVYGKIKWSSYFRRFAIVFSSNSNEVSFDFDDDIVKLKSKR